MKSKKIRTVLGAFLLLGFSRNDESSKVKGRKLKEHEKHLYITDISSISIQFKDASKHSIEEIINTVEAAKKANGPFDK